MSKILYHTHHANHSPRSPYGVAWEIILSSRGSSQFLNRLSNVFGDRSHLISYNFPKLLSAYLGVSGRTFGSVLAQMPRSSIDLVDASGRTTLSWAAGKGDRDAMKELLRCGADPSHADKDGWTPLHWSAYAQNHECVRLLLAAKADINAKDRHGNTAFSIALYNTEIDNPDLVEILISHGADIESINEDGWTPLHLAAWRNNAKCLSLLLRKGADINAKDSYGNNTLKIAIIFNCHQAVKTLLDHGGSDYDIKDVFGQTWLHLAALYGDLDMIEILRSANLSEVDLAAIDIIGRSALDCAEWRYKCNEEWSNWKCGAMDEDPLRCLSAFKALWDDIVERQDSAYGGGDSEDEEWEDEEQEDEEQEDEEQEDWQDAPEVTQEESNLHGTTSLPH